MKKQHLLLGKLLLFCLILFTGCKKDVKEQPAPSTTSESTDASDDELIRFLARTTGYAQEDIAYVDSSDLYVIDHDLLITKEEAKKFYAKDAESAGARITHYRGTYLVSDTYVKNIKVYIEPAVPAAWVTATLSSMDQWNSVSGTKLVFSRVTSAALANIRVFPGYEASGPWVARAYLPTSDGRPGRTVEINTYYNSYDAGRKLFTIAHELGHTFGLLHTNQTAGTFIPGTPVTDANSIMNSYVLSWSGFTSGDITAVRRLYPDNTYWQLLPGAAYDIGVGTNGSAWVIGRGAVAGGYGIHYWNGSNWTGVAGGAVQIAVSSAGVPWIVNNAGQIFRRNGASWQLLPGLAYDIAVGGTSSAWVIGRSVVPGGYSIHYWTGTNWTAVAGGAVRIAVSPSGTPWVINNAGQIFRRSGGGWELMPGLGTDIGIAGDGSVYITGRTAVAGGYPIYKFTGSGWKLIDGGATRISAGPALPWVVNSAGQIFRRQ